MSTTVIDRPEVPTVDPLEIIPVLPEEPKILTEGQKLIQKAMRVWEKTGWCKDTLVDFEGRVCALGALDLAYTGYTLRSGDPRRRQGAYGEAVDRIMKVIGKEASPYRSNANIVANHNDMRDYPAMRKIFEDALKS